MSDSATTLSGIFAKFSRRRKDAKVAAWMELQTDLAESAGVICPSAVSLKDLIAAIANIEDMMRGQTGEAGISPAEYLEKWLGDADATPAPAATAVPQ